MYECQSVECALTSPVNMESVMLVMCSMQYVICLRLVLCNVLFVWILTNCSSVMCVLMFIGMSKWVNVMLCM